RLHLGHQAGVPGVREAADRHGRPQPGHGLERGGAVRRRQAVRVRARGRPRGHRRVPVDQVRRHGDVTDPLEQLAHWYEHAVAAGLPEPEAMALATATPDGAPSVRFVLLKGIDARGVEFYTNYDSRKGRELAANPRAALAVLWKPLQRQVRLEGPVERLAPAAADAYFAPRSRGSRLGAWASGHSREIADREGLEERLVSFEAQYPDDVRRPAHWGGYVLRPETIEFWEGRPNRLHDRELFTRDERGWTSVRLSP